jgi:2-haloacid dehalogenase
VVSDGAACDSARMVKPLTAFRAVSLDCYGTLIDWETGIWDAVQPVLMADAARPVTRPTLLAAFAETEHHIQAERPFVPYPEVLRRCHVALARRFGLRTTDALDAAFGASVGQWPAFPDTVDALRALQRHVRLVILSNIDRASFAASNRKLGVAFDAIYTAEDIGSYKPDPRTFAYLQDQVQADLGLTVDEVLHTAQSLFHDHVPARAAGLATAWIDRHHLAAQDTWGATPRVAVRPAVDYSFPTLAALAHELSRLHQREA